MMNRKFLRGLCAAVCSVAAPTLAVATAHADVIVSEVAPWSSGNGTLGADWFEVTNTGAAAVNISSWKVDDSSNSFAAALPLLGITSIAPGESVIFIESPPGAITTSFKTLWFGASAPAALQVGTYSGSGVGLSTSGDAINLFDAGGVLQANVSFGASPAAAPFATFDNAAGLQNVSISALSAVGVNGAFVAPNDATEIGSPGTIGAAPVALLTVVATDASASEVGHDPGTFRISRSGSTASALTVNYTVSSGAGQANGSDFTPALSGVVSIPAAASFVDITITPASDNSIEGSEAVSLTLTDTSSYDVGSPATATITIADGPVSAAVPALPPVAFVVLALGIALISWLATSRRRA